MTGRVDYDRMAASYDRGRELPLEGLREWRAALAVHPPVTGGSPVLDLGAGTGLFAAAIATWFDFAGLPGCARELRRVLRPGGPVLIRTAFPGRLDGITLFRLFPGAARVAETFPTVEATVGAFEAAGFAFQALRPVPQVTAPSLRAAVERVRLRADTTLQALGDGEFAAGLVPWNARPPPRPPPPPSSTTWIYSWSVDRVSSGGDLGAVVMSMWGEPTPPTAPVRWSVGSRSGSAGPRGARCGRR
jgi:hypothetical protein